MSEDKKTQQPSKPQEQPQPKRSDFNEDINKNANVPARVQPTEGWSRPPKKKE